MRSVSFHQWEEVLRLAASIRHGTVTASLIIRKLASYPRQNSLHAALREVGRIGTHPVYARMDAGSRTPEARSSRAKQGRGQKRAGPGSLLQSPRRTSRPNFRKLALPCQRTKLGGARDHIVEHDVSRARFQCTARTWDRLSRCAPYSRLADRMGAHQPDWGLHLARQPSRI